MRQFNFEEYNNKLGKSGRETLALAIEESRKRDHNYLSAYHLILALLLIEAKFFEDLLSKTSHGVNELRKLINSRLSEMVEPNTGRGLKISFEIKSLFRLSWISSFKHGRNKISSADFIQACIEMDKSPLMECLKALGVASISVVEQLEPRLMDPVSREMKSSELSDDDKKSIHEAVQADDYWKAYEILNSFYNRMYENIESDKKRLHKIPVQVDQLSPRAFRVVAIIILIALLLILLLLAAEQIIAADPCCASSVARFAIH